MTAQLGITTSGWFEVEVFDEDGNYVIRRHVEKLEEAKALLDHYLDGKPTVHPDAFSPRPCWAPSGTSPAVQGRVEEWARNAEPADIAMNIVDEREIRESAESELAELRLMVEDFGRGIRSAVELFEAAREP